MDNGGLDPRTHPNTTDKIWASTLGRIPKLVQRTSILGRIPLTAADNGGLDLGTHPNTADKVWASTLGRIPKADNVVDLDPGTHPQTDGIVDIDPGTRPQNW